MSQLWSLQNAVTATTHDALKFVLDNPPSDIPDKTIDADNAAQVLTTIMVTGLKLVPKVGSLLSGLVTVMCPDKNQTSLSWPAMQSKVEGICQDAIDEAAATSMMERAKGIVNLLNDYLMQVDQDMKSKWFVDFLGALDAIQPEVTDSQTRLTVEYLVPIGTLHLAALRAQCTSYKDIHGTDDKIHDAHVKSLNDTADAYVAALGKAREKCVEWRRGRITSKETGRFRPSFGDQVADYELVSTLVEDPPRQVSRTFNWTDPPSDNFDHVKIALKDQFIWEQYDQMNNVWTKSLDDALHPATLWSLYKIGSGPETVQRLYLEHPGWAGDGISSLEQQFQNPPWPLNHNAPVNDYLTRLDHPDMFLKYGNITKIIFHQSDNPNRLLGMEVFYGGQSSGLIGRASGEVGEWAVDIGPDEMVSRLDWEHKAQTYLRFLDVTTIQKGSQSFKRGPCWGPGTYNYGHGSPVPVPSNPVRLLWFRGWSTDAQGWCAVQSLWPVFGYYETISKDGTIVYS